MESSTIFGNIFSSPESTKIWSDIGRTTRYVEFESALAFVQGKLEIIPAHAADEIVKASKISNIDMEELRVQTETIGYPVLGVVKQLVRRVNAVEPGLGEWTHWGATTQDITDTATVLQLRDTFDLINIELKSIVADLRLICEKHIATPMAARSNLQQAVPMSFGFKCARLLATFERHQQRIAEILPRLLVVEFGGAAGTLATISNGLGLKCQAALAEHLALGVPEIAWHTERDRIAEVGGIFALLTGTCSKFAMDVKLMMQTEVGEVSEPYYPHRGSSSTMPQKRNPISSVYITAMAATVRALSGGLYEAMVEDHERSTGPWEIEWIALPQISTLTHACMKTTAVLVKGLEVHPAAMQRNLEISKGNICSEAVMMGLGPSLGRQFAHDLVYDLCKKAADEDRFLLDLLKEDPKVKESGLTDEELAKLCDPKEYLGMSVEMVQRVLNHEYNL